MKRIFSTPAFAISLLFLMFANSSAYSQYEDSVKSAVHESIQKAIVLNISAGKCYEDFTVSSAFILFSSEGEVEKVVFSNTPECIFGSKEKIENKLKSSFDKLNLNKTLFSNQFILVVITTSLEVYPNLTKTTPSPTEIEIFKGIDERIVANRKLKYCLTVNTQLKRIRN